MCRYRAVLYRIPFTVRCIFLIILCGWCLMFIWCMVLPTFSVSDAPASTRLIKHAAALSATTASGYIKFGQTRDCLVPHDPFHPDPTLAVVVLWVPPIIPTDPLFFIIRLFPRYSISSSFSRPVPLSDCTVTLLFLFNNS